MPADKVRVAVIGAGYLGRFHAQKYANIEKADLAYVVEVIEDRAGEVAAETGAEPETDYKRVLDKVDAVSIVTPTASHHRIARDCIEAGLDVLLEKPITETVAQAEELAELAGQNGKILLSGHLERFNPPIVKLQDALIRPAFIVAERLGGFKERAANVDVILDLMIHDLDIILAFVDSPVKRVSAIGVPVLSDKIDLANARLEFENGAVANLTASRVSIGEGVRKIRIFQHESYTSIDYQNQKMAVFTVGPGDDGDPMSRIKIEEVELDRQDALELEIRAFIDSVISREKPLVGGIEATRALKTALDVIEAIGHTPSPEDLV